MQIFIMRHGNAGLNIINNKARELTPNGVDESKLMGSWLAKKNIAFKRVFTSPYVRAVQTYQAMQPLLPYSVEPKVLVELIPNGNPQSVANYLQLFADDGLGKTLIISHLPLVGNLVSALCSQKIVPIFATSAIVCIEMSTKMRGFKYKWQRKPAQILQDINKLSAHF